MTREEILSMAREAGFIVRNNMPRTIHSNGSWVCVADELESFAELVAIRAVDAEREACAALCEAWNTAMTDNLAESIRARGSQ
jgi:hypothetical protein